MSKNRQIGDEEPAYFSDDPVDLKLKKRNGLSARINQSLMVFVLLVTSSTFLGSTLAANISLSGGRETAQMLYVMVKPMQPELEWVVVSTTLN